MRSSRRTRRVEAAVGNDALAGFEAPFFNSMVLALDRWFVHRVRAVSGKDGNPLNEVELIVDSVMTSGGVLCGNNVIKYVPGESVLGLEIGDRISLTREQFERLSEAFLAEIERRFSGARLIRGVGRRTVPLCSGGD